MRYTTTLYPFIQLATLLLVLFATPSYSKAIKTRTSISRDPGIYPGGRKADKTGWRMLPDVAGALVDTGTIAVGENATLTSYVSNGTKSANVKRAVIMVHGMNRDSWNQWLYADLALQRAASAGQVKHDEVVIMAPQFFTSVDYGAYDATMGGDPISDQLIWKDESWAEGVPSVNPPDSKVGAFDALDAAINFFLDRERFPNMVTVVVGGFSLGAQLVQRYSLLRPINADQDPRINYWVCSPNAFLYLNSTRPLSVKGCPNWNAYKYGLEGILPDYIAQTNQTGLITQTTLSSRLLSRRTTYAVGLEDHTAGSGECEARTQGRTHLSKMTYWTENGLPFIPGSTQKTGKLPLLHTLDYVTDVSHQDYRMIQSDPAVRSLFLEDYNVRGKTVKAPKSNGLKGGQRRNKDDDDGNDDDSGVGANVVSLASLIFGAVCTVVLTAMLS